MSREEIEQVIRMADIQGLIAEARAFETLRIESPAPTEIHFSSHQVGSKSHSLLGMLLSTVVGDDVDLANDVFLLPYTEDIDRAKRRLEGWFERSVAKALGAWRRRI